MSLIHGNIAGEHLDDAKIAIARITHQHFQSKDKYKTEEEFISDLVEKVVNRAFIENAHYTEKLVVTMLKELISEN